MSTTEIELSNICAIEGNTGGASRSADQEEELAPLHAVSLPPMDHGFDAWAYLASAFVVELLVWAYPFSYGVFLDYYTSHVFKDSPSTLLPLVGSLSSGIIYLTSPLIIPFMAWYPQQKRNVMSLGVVLCVVGLTGAAFATKPWQLVITQGITYSLGGTLLYFPVMTFLYEWFQEKRGLANGLIYSGTGIGGVVIPFIIERLLHTYGQRTTFLALAISFALLVLPTFKYLKPRTPPALTVAPRHIDVGFLKKTPFWVLFISNLIQGLANFVPTLYLPTFAKDLHLNSTSSVIALSVLNGSSALGLIFFGYLSDKFDLRLSILLSAIGSSLSVLFLWGFSASLVTLVFFAATYGFLAPSWSALWPRFISAVAGNDVQQSATLMSVFVAGRGVGNVLSAPISAGLLHPWSLTGHSNVAYGIKGYGPLITFTGLTLFISTLGVGYKSFGSTSVGDHAIRRRRMSADQGHR